MRSGDEAWALASISAPSICKTIILLTTMKQLFSFVFALFLCVPMCMQAKGAAPQDNKKEQTNLIDKAQTLSQLAGEMAEISDTLLRASVKGNSAFYAKEKEYWTRIKEDAQFYADSANCAKLKGFYAASADYWYRMHDCYSQALVNNPADSLFWNKAIEQTQAMAGMVFDLAQDAVAPASEAAAASPNDSTAQAVEQYTIESDMTAFYERYKTIVGAKEAQSKSQQLYVWIFGAISALAVLALLVALAVFLVRRLRGRKTNEEEDGYAPVVKVMYGEEVQSCKPKKNKGNNKKDKSQPVKPEEKSLSQRLKVAGCSKDCYPYFLDNTKHYVEQTLTCPAGDIRTYQEQLVNYFCRVSGKNKYRDSFKKLVDTPLWRKQEGETVRFALPAMIDSNLIKGLTQYYAKSKERTITYAAWPPFPISDDVTVSGVSNTNLADGLSAQVSELAKHIDELRDFLGVKADKKEELIDEAVADRLDDAADTEDIPALDSEENAPAFDVKALATMFETIGKSMSSLEAQADNLGKALETSGADSSALRLKLQETENNLTEREGELIAAVAEKDKAVAEKDQAVKDAVDEAENRHRVELEAVRNESQKYRECLIFYAPVQQLAAKVVKILDANFTAVQTLERLGTLVDPSLVTDDFHYYINRIRDKYARLIGDHARNNFELISELRELAHHGLVPAGGVVDKWLKNTKPEQLEDTLNQNIYNQLLRPYIGATIIMADECAYLLPKMQPGTVPDKAVQTFKACTKQAKEAAESLGYAVVYAKPLEPMSKYKNVVNKEYASESAPVNSGDIFEVFSMAVNFGNSVDKTQVSAKH